MRIISGSLKGRRLKSFKVDHIRPTTDRVKETLFNILRGRIDGARVLDLFSGTGNLAIEAWSRGAKKVTAVENHRRSLALIRENLIELNIKSENFEVIGKDVFAFIKKYEGDPFDIVFVDPPFTEKWAEACLTALSLSRIGTEQSLVVIEAGTKELVKNEYGPLKLLDQRAFGDKSAHIYQWKVL